MKLHLSSSMLVFLGVLSACAARGSATGSARAEGSIEASAAASGSVGGDVRAEGLSRESAEARAKVVSGQAPQLPTNGSQARPIGLSDDQEPDEQHSSFRIVREAKGYTGQGLQYGRLLNVASGFLEGEAFTVSELDVDVHAKLEGKYDELVLFGNWPDATFLSTRAPYGEETIQRWDQTKKAFVLLSKDRGLYGVARWKNGSLLGLERLGMHYLPRPENIRAQFRVLSGSATPPASPRVRGRGKCLKEADVLAFDALPSGEIFALVRECPHVAPPYELNIQRWDEAGRRVIESARDMDFIQVLGVEDRMGGDVAAVSPTEVYVVVNAVHPKTLEPIPYLLLFDGRGWQRLSVPTKNSLTSVAVAKDGAVWVTAFNDPTECVSDRGVPHNCSRGQLWRLSPKSRVAAQVPLPFVKENNVQPMIPYRVRAYQAGIWVAAKTISSQRHALLFTRNL